MINLLLVDDHPVVLHGLTSVFRDETEIQNIGIAQNKEEVLAYLRNGDNLPVHLVILDLELDDASGKEIAEILRNRYQDIKILIFTMHDKWNDILELQEIGIDGYVMKGTDQEELLDAIYKIVVEGKTYFGEGYQRKIKEMRNLNGKAIKLPKREKEVLSLFAQGKTSQEIAKSLGIKHSTVETYKTRLRKKTKTKSLKDLIKWAIDQGFS